MKKKLGVLFAALLVLTVVGMLWGPRIVAYGAMRWFEPDFKRVVAQGRVVKNYLKSLEASVRAGDEAALLAMAPVALRDLPACAETARALADLPEVQLVDWTPDEEAPACDPWKNLAAHWGPGSEVQRALLKLHNVNVLDDTTCEPRVRLMFEGRDVDGRRRLDVVYGYLLVDFSSALPVVQTAAMKRVSSVVSTGEPVFRDEAVERGLVGGRSRIPLRDDLKFSILPYLGGGLAVGDIDGDGWEDVLLAGAAQGETRLLRNVEGNFTDVTEVAGLRDVGELVMGAVLGDLDGDGDLDGVLTHAYTPPELLRNQGNGRFSLEPLPSGKTAQVEGSTTPTLADVDNDGDLDLYVAYHAPAMEEVPQTIFIGLNGQQDRLWINDGKGGFTDETLARGLESTRWGFQGSFADFDDDGDVDIYQVNDFGRNTLFVNDGSGHFHDGTGDWAGSEAFGFGMSAAWGDYDTDGDLDLYIAGLASGVQWYAHDPAVIKYYVASLKAGNHLSPEAMTAVMNDVKPYAGRFGTKGRRVRMGPFQGNFLLRHDEGGFADVSESSDTYFAQWGWGAGFVDFQNDGRPDLHAMTGFITSPMQDDL
jgi:hypothetical protein